MKCYEEFSHCLSLLKEHNRDLFRTSGIYRAGMIAIFSRSFGMALRVLYVVLIQHSVEDAAKGTPLEVVKLGIKHHLVSDEDIWFDMLKKWDVFTYCCNGGKMEDLIPPLFKSYLPALERFRDSIAGEFKSNEDK